MESCDTGEHRTFLQPTRRRKNGQAVNLDTVVERVCHAGRKRWCGEKRLPTPFLCPMPEPNSYDPHSSYSGVVVGNRKLVQADQLSGRVIAVSNAAVFKIPCSMTHREPLYVI